MDEKKQEVEEKPAAVVETPKAPIVAIVEKPIKQKFQEENSVVEVNIEQHQKVETPRLKTIERDIGRLEIEPIEKLPPIAQLPP